MKSIVERQHTPILEGLNTLTDSVLSGKRVVRDHEDVWDKHRRQKKIIYRLGGLLLSEHEKLIGSY
jgi:hypothetical protein